MMRRNKYDSFEYSSGENSIKDFIMSSEHIIWSGKPKKNAFIINKCLINMPFALLWLGVDSFLIGMINRGSKGIGFEVLFYMAFFAIHLIPFWMWLANVLSSNKEWKNTEYAVTDKRIIIKRGVISHDYQIIYYTDIKSVDLHIGLIDRILGVGDILISINEPVLRTSAVAGNKILDLENPYQVFKIIQKTVLDIQTDIHYPNELRPGTNRGYNTKYRP